MTRYILDTDIISNLAKAQPSPTLLACSAEQTDDELYIASITLAEILRGILELPSGRKRRALQGWFESDGGPQVFFQSRILPFDEAAALL